ncbi:MAG: type II secretion system protein [Clostridia bacterium]|nr:type II secretion system protein [Clostridia bacterium]
MNLRKNNGITMVSLVLTIMILLIITGCVLSIKNPLPSAKRLSNFKNDLLKLEKCVDAYYLQNSTLPILENISYTNISMLTGTIKNPNDNENYFVIDLDLLVDDSNRRITLNYGNDGFSTIKNGGNSRDVYIINESTHTIYYPNGVAHEDITYYTKEDSYAQIELNDIVNKVTMRSSDEMIEYAGPGDTITVTVELKREFNTTVTATIAGRSASVSSNENGKIYTATYEISPSETSLPTGNLTFSIEGITQQPITTVTEGRAVTYSD